MNNGRNDLPKAIQCFWYSIDWDVETLWSLDLPAFIGEEGWLPVDYLRSQIQVETLPDGSIQPDPARMFHLPNSRKALCMLTCKIRRPAPMPGNVDRL